MYPVSKHDAAIATLAYGKIFDYTLTKQEYVRWFLFYPIRAVPKEKDRRLQKNKWILAKRAVLLLSVIPTIRLIGVTGGLAMNNAKNDDDIDLFLVVSDWTLWVSRMFATVLMDICGLRRHPKDMRVANKICLNMFMTESAMKLAKSDQDCFTAHEVLQMEPLFVRGNTYRRFLDANRWVKKYLPNAWRWRVHSKWKIENRKFLFTIYYLLFTIFEPLAKSIQIWYMKKHRTNEIISDTVLRFHPKDARVWIKRRLRARLAKHHIPLDKIFYAR